MSSKDFIIYCLMNWKMVDTLEERMKVRKTDGKSVMIVIKPPQKKSDLAREVYWQKMLISSFIRMTVI